MPFNLEAFISGCVSAIEGDKPQKSITELVRNAVAEPNPVFNEIGKPDQAKIEKLYVSDDLTILALQEN